MSEEKKINGHTPEEAAQETKELLESVLKKVLGPNAPKVEMVPYDGTPEGLKKVMEGIQAQVKKGDCGCKEKTPKGSIEVHGKRDSVVDMEPLENMLGSLAEQGVTFGCVLMRKRRHEGDTGQISTYVSGGENPEETYMNVLREIGNAWHQMKYGPPNQG